MIHESLFEHGVLIQCVGMRGCVVVADLWLSKEGGCLWVTEIWSVNYEHGCEFFSFMRRDGGKMMVVTKLLELGSPLRNRREPF